MKHIRTVLSPEPISVEANENADRAAALMWTHDIGFLCVIDAEHGIVGALTDRDIAMAAHLSGRPLTQIPVRRIMSKELHSCSPDDTPFEVLEAMTGHQVRRLPVQEGGRLMGVISVHDLARFAAASGDKHLAQAVVEALGAIAAPRRVMAKGGVEEDVLDRLRTLEQARDELRVQVQLGKAEAKDEWRRAEARWHRLQSRLSVVQNQAQANVKTVTAAWSQLIDEVHEGYRKTRAALTD